MSETGLAVIAGEGALPADIANHCAAAGIPCHIVHMAGTRISFHPELPVIEGAFERFGTLFDDLKEAGCHRVVFAGAMRRPRLDPARFDTRTMQLVQRVAPALASGDDATLRAIAGEFELEGFVVVAADQVVPGLVAPAGAIGQHAPSAADLRDMERAAELARVLGAADVGQAAVVAQGLCLGLESLQGTDVLLEFVAHTAEGLRPDPNGSYGVLYKGPKPDQDMRFDMPVIGPRTVKMAAEAGLAGIAVAAGGVMLLERAELVREADALNLFLYGLETGSGG